MSALERALAAMRLRAAPGLPTQIHLSVTDRCFLPCLHCDIYKNKTEDLPEEAWARTLDRLAVWLGPAAVNFVGGEPLLRKDLERLMGRAAALGFTVSFNTNGWLLTDARAEALCAAGAQIAYVSLDGHRRETVDHSRGRAGSYDKALEACARLDRHPNPRVVIACSSVGASPRTRSGVISRRSPRRSRTIASSASRASASKGGGGSMR